MSIFSDIFFIIVIFNFFDKKLESFLMKRVLLRASTQQNLIFF